MLAPLLIMINGLFRAACAALRGLGAEDIGLTIQRLRPIDDVSIYHVAGQGALLSGSMAAALAPVATMRIIDGSPMAPRRPASTNSACLVLPAWR